VGLKPHANFDGKGVWVLVFCMPPPRDVSAESAKQTPEEIAAAIAAYAVRHAECAVLEDGRVIFDPRTAKHSITTEHGRCMCIRRRWWCCGIYRRQWSGICWRLMSDGGSRYAWCGGKQSGKSYP
jgi:hypothetical protein